MKRLLRALVTFVVVIAAYHFVYWLPFSLMPLNGQRWVAPVVSLFCAIGAGWFVWTRTRSVPSTLISSVLYGSIVVGAVGFSAGFFGPIIFAPEANQGPLLGIFITGPAGILVGAVGGFAYWLRVQRGPNAAHHEHGP